MAADSSKVFVVTSGKGGVGKTTVTANLGTALALRGRRVVVVDADIGLRNLDVVMGLENRIVYDLVQLIEGECHLQQALIRDKLTRNLYLLAAAQTRNKSAVSADQMRELAGRLRSDFDYVMIDSPAGIEQGFQNAIAPADGAIVVSTPEVSAIRDADRVIGLVEAATMPSPQLLLNRVKADMVRRQDMMSTDDITSLLSVSLLGLVPEDERIVVSSNRGVPTAHDARAPSGRAFQAIAARLEGDDVPSWGMDQHGGVFERIRKLVRLGGE